MVRSAPCSYPVVTSALRERLSKPLSEIVYLRTMVRTLRPLEEGIETDMQTSSMSLLDVMVYFAYRSACSAQNWTVSPWFQQQKSVSETYEIWTRLCLASNSLYMHCAGVSVEQGTVIRNLFLVLRVWQEIASEIIANLPMKINFNTPVQAWDQTC